MSHRAALLVVLAIWLLPSAMFVPWILVYRQKVFSIFEFDYVACHADWNDPLTGRAFTIAVVFLTCYFIPLTFIAVFCVLIGIKVWRRRVRGLVGPRTEQNILAAKTTVLKILVVVVVLFAMSWLPLYAIALRNLFGPEMTGEQKGMIKKYLSPVAQWLGAANSCVNPFVYCYYSSNFRIGVRRLLGRTTVVGADDRPQTTPRRTVWS